MPASAMGPGTNAYGPAAARPEECSPEDEEDPLTTEPALRDAEQQARLQERQARWMGVAVFVVVLLAALALH